jgi:two-component system, chemotaxis family, chemotaxis protein CheY
MRILLVDDSKTMRNIQKAVLTQLGYTDLIEAVDGQDALLKASSDRPGLMLVDWNMPNMDGVTFVRAWRETDRATPIIMVTTEAERGRVIEAIKAGVNNYVVKPFTPEMLKARIEDTLRRIRPASTTPSTPTTSTSSSLPPLPSLPPLSSLSSRPPLSPLPPLPPLSSRLSSTSLRSFTTSRSPSASPAAPSSPRVSPPPPTPPPTDAPRS